MVSSNGNSRLHIVKQAEMNVIPTASIVKFEHLDEATSGEELGSLHSI